MAAIFASWARYLRPGLTSPRHAGEPDLPRRRAGGPDGLDLPALVLAHAVGKAGVVAGRVERHLADQGRCAGGTQFVGKAAGLQRALVAGPDDGLDQQLGLHVAELAEI